MRRVVIGLSSALLIACGGASSSGPDQGAAYAGTFALVTINNKALPYTPRGIADSSVAMLSDVLTFKSGSVVTEATTIRKITNGVAAVSVTTQNGSYVIQGSMISVLWPGSGADYFITTDGLVTTIPGFNETWVYKKQ